MKTMLLNDVDPAVLLGAVRSLDAIPGTSHHVAQESARLQEDLSGAFTTFLKEEKDEPTYALEIIAK